MTNRRVIYRTPEYRVTFQVDESGKTGSVSLASENGAQFNGNVLNAVPFQALAEFARQYGNVTVNTADLKTPGRRASGV